jgi:1-phosphofructokinase family hexose kinase
MLLAVTPNPALDRTLVIPGMQPGGVYRAERVLLAAGGKGLNVARAARTLGQELRVCGPLAGHTGTIVAELAASEGLDARWSWYRGDTRTCVLVVDPHGSDATALNEPGQALAPHDWQAFVETVISAATDAQLITISGSMPPGVPPGELATLVRRLTECGYPACIIDSSSAALQAALESAPYGIKVNAAELGAVLGTNITTLTEAAAALRQLRQRGIALPIVTLGAQGALAASEMGVCHVQPPQLDTISSVGSGDSLLAGLATGLLRGSGLTDALSLGVACGSADALTIGGGLIDPDEVERLRAAVRVTWL